MAKNKQQIYGDYEATRTFIYCYWECKSFQATCKTIISTRPECTHIQ